MAIAMITAPPHQPKTRKRVYCVAIIAPKMVMP